LPTDVELAKLTSVGQIADRIKYDIAARMAPNDLTDIGEPPKTKVLYDQNKFVGFITHIRNNLKNGHIMFLYVDKDLRGKGYGRTLVEAAQQDLFSTGSVLWVPVVSPKGGNY
jgi:ribosomal protein S18 acetylase RimI-like enzyme